MSAPTYNLLAARKTIAAIHYRLAEAGLDAAIRRRIIMRQLEDLDDTLPARKFANIIMRCIRAHKGGDTLELVAGLALLESILPKPTWGAIPAGTAVQIPNGGIYIKRKNGAEEIHTSALFRHFDADQQVKLVNE